jgi:diadenosine tetraphosphate (Ap4A) HIT family hydrolase
MFKNCLICQRISQILKNKNPYFVAELKTGYVVIADHQLFKGYTLFLCKQHKTELFKLETDYKLKFLKEMSMVSEAVFKAFKPKKLNYELLGNTDSHLHWHIIPRYHNDPKPLNPIWSIDSSVRNANKHKPTDMELKKIKNKLLLALNKIMKQDL